MGHRRHHDKAMGLMDRHPLQDVKYLAQLERERGLSQEPVGRIEEAGPRERNFQAEIYTGAEAAKLGRASYNSFNVAVTRAWYQARVFTNSVPGLKQAVLTVDEKTSTVENKLGMIISRLTSDLVKDNAAAARPV